MKRETEGVDWESKQFREFINNLVRLRTGSKKLSEVMSRLHIRTRTYSLIENKYLWREWWNMDFLSYKKNSQRRLIAAQGALRDNDIVGFNVCLFERLRILRNQIIHGSSSSTTRKNRDALYPAILLLEEILPEFIRLMIHHGRGSSWPPIPYPSKGTPQHPE